MPGLPTIPEILAESARRVSEQGRAVLCHVVRAEGSTPGKLGWKLLVSPDGTAYGNLGGGAFEAMVTVDARETLSRAEASTDSVASEVRRYYLTEDAVARKGEATGMVCGGMIEVLLEFLSAPPMLVVCGGGPVGQAVARAGTLAGFEPLVAEDRAEYRDPGLFPGGTRFAEVSARYEQEFLSDWRARELYVAIVSRCWETDAAALASVLDQDPERLRYLGLMGSERKIERVREEVLDRGLSLDGVDLDAPIGLPIGGDTPGEIAISILGEIVRRRNAAASGTTAPSIERVS